MFKKTLLALIVCLSSSAFAQIHPFELYNLNASWMLRPYEGFNGSLMPMSSSIADYISELDKNAVYSGCESNIKALRLSLDGRIVTVYQIFRLSNCKKQN
ncbi:hypothetical protein MRY82_10570 [bacterium]|nr:hypothetical protein [bacterium]